MAASSAASKSKRRFIAKLLGAASLCATLPALAQDASPRPRLDVDYQEIVPQPVLPGGRIEVVEFFWYGCPYCYALQPSLDAWLQARPRDVAFRYVPAMLRNSWAPAARIYYTLKALGNVGRLQDSVYAAYHVERLDMDESGVAADWAMRHDINRKAWLAAYRSQAVDRDVDHAVDLTQRYGITGTPSIVVDGRYLTSTGMTPSPAAVIPVVKELVALARARRAKD